MNTREVLGDLIEDYERRANFKQLGIEGTQAYALLVIARAMEEATVDRFRAQVRA